MEEGIGIAFTGKCLIQLNRTNEAMPLLLQAEAIFKEVNSKLYLTKVHVNMMEIYNDLGQYKKAKYFAEDAIKNSRELKILWIENLAQYELAVANVALGNYKEAYEAILAHKCVNTQLWEEIKTKEIADIQIKYQSEQKEKENALLRKDIV